MCVLDENITQRQRSVPRFSSEVEGGNLSCNDFISFHLDYVSTSFMTLSEVRLNKSFRFCAFFSTLYSLWIHILCFSESDPQSILSAAIHRGQTCKETDGQTHRQMDKEKSGCESASQGVNQPHRGWKISLTGGEKSASQGVKNQPHRGGGWSSPHYEKTSCRRKDSHLIPSSQDCDNSWWPLATRWWRMWSHTNCHAKIPWRVARIVCSQQRNKGREMERPTICRQLGR